MSFPVVSSLSAEELVELGQEHEKHSTHQTGTLITGNDVSTNNGIFSCCIETFLVRKRGKCATGQWIVWPVPYIEHVFANVSTDTDLQVYGLGLRVLPCVSGTLIQRSKSRVQESSPFVYPLRPACA